jgi:hypothetical protein
MKYWFLFLVLIAPLALWAQRDLRRAPTRTITPLGTSDFLVIAPANSSVPGPNALVDMQAGLSGFTNGVRVDWSALDASGITLSTNLGLTNLGTFTAVGQFTIGLRGRLGAYTNGTRFFVFVNDSGVTNFAPFVTLTSPPNGASQYTAPVDLLLSADATDKEGPVARVVFYNGSLPMGTSTVAPFSFIYSNAQPGNYLISAIATDSSGATKVSQASSVVVNPPVVLPVAPVVNITFPANGSTYTAPVTVSVQATATDSDGLVSDVTFLDNGSFIGTDAVAPYQVSFSPAVGTHHIAVTATDNSGLMTTDSIDITVANPPNQIPTATLTSPANGSTFTAPANVTATVTASDPDGSIGSVQFFLDGVDAGTDSSSPYSVVVPNLGVGTYAISAKARDNIGAIGLTGTNTITVNPPPGIPPTVTFLTPANNAMYKEGQTVSVSASAVANSGTITNISHYTVLPDLSDPESASPGSETLLSSGSSSPHTFVWSAPVGTYFLESKAWNSFGLISTSSPLVKITVNQLIPPFVQITDPTNSQNFNESSNMVIAATATDQDGTVTSVRFYKFAPNKMLLGADSTSPYAGSWTNLPPGDWSITAEAVDSDGLTNVSQAISIHVIPIPPNPITVDAGANQIAALSVYQLYADTEYTTQSNFFNGIFANSDGAALYNGAFPMDGMISLYEATLQTNYLNQALKWCETIQSRCTLPDVAAGKKNWPGTDVSHKYSSGNIAYLQEELQGAAPVLRACLVTLSDPLTRAVWGTRATTIYNFFRDQVVNKQWFSRTENQAWFNNYLFNTSSGSTGSGVTDKHWLYVRSLIYAKSISDILVNGDNSTYGYPQLQLNFAQGLKDYNGALNQMISYNGGLVWARGKLWFYNYNNMDTSHANRIAAGISECYQRGVAMDLATVNGFCFMFANRIWNGSTSNPLFNNFHDGSNIPFNTGSFTYAPNENSLISYGWAWLGEYDTNCFSAAASMLRFIKNGGANISSQRNNSQYYRFQLAADLSKNVTRGRGWPPYAMLAGSISGSGTTSTNWSRVSGPGSATIVSPTKAATTILFGTNAANVGTHQFRLTVASASATNTDTVNVVLNAAPAF